VAQKATLGTQKLTEKTRSNTKTKQAEKKKKGGGQTSKRDQKQIPSVNRDKTWGTLKLRTPGNLAKSGHMKYKKTLAVKKKTKNPTFCKGKRRNAKVSIA